MKQSRAVSPFLNPASLCCPLWASHVLLRPSPISRTTVDGSLGTCSHSERSVRHMRCRITASQTVRLPQLLALVAASRVYRAAHLQPAMPAAALPGAVSYERVQSETCSCQRQPHVKAQWHRLRYRMAMLRREPRRPLASDGVCQDHD